MSRRPARFLDLARLRQLALVTAAITMVLGRYATSADQTLVQPGSSWKYNDTGANLGIAWRSAAYNDAAWPSGPAQLGYGDGDEATILTWGSDATNRRITSYFRRTFTVVDPSRFAALTMRFVRDDGLIVYMNGVEVVRANMPGGVVSYTTTATTAIGGADESAWIEMPVDPSALVAGANLLAVELHQQSPTSSDISFDLELRATEATAPAPTVTLTAPADRDVVNTAAVDFTASVSAPAGLAEATLFIGGPPDVSVFSGPTEVEDAQISADTPAVADGEGASINVDGQTPHAHGLLKFPTLVGDSQGQVPAGSIVTSATLQLNCTNAGHVMRLYRLTESWVENQATWTERAPGLPWGAAGADGALSNAGVSIDGDCTAAGQRLVDITSFVQQWANGLPNHGVVITDSGTDGIDFGSSESAGSPVLTVVYKTTQMAVDTRELGGTSAAVTFSATLTPGQTYHWNIRATDVEGRQGWAPSDAELIVDLAAPDAPVLVSPADGAMDVDPSATLSAIVSDPSGGQLTAGVELRRAAGAEFTLIALPDTQHYSEAFPAVFTSQTQWIVDNRGARNIVFVTHEGDIVEHNSLVTEWERANTSMSLLDGVVPYGMGPGNHDQPTTLYNQYFPYTRYQGRPWYGGHMGSLNDNNFQLFSAGGLDFVIVHLEFCPPAAAVTWADGVLKTHPDRIGIMTTHGYLNESAARGVHGCTNTQYLWDGLAVPNPNLRFMLSGHVHDESRRTDAVNGRTVHQMLADYQDRATGGEGWLRILRFVPADDKVYVQTYSPWLGRFETDANSEFTLDFPMGGAWSETASTTAQSQSVASIAMSNLEPNTEYEWRMTVTNAGGRSRAGPIWTFTTGSGAVNQPPSGHAQSLSTPEDTALPLVLSGFDPEDGALTFSLASQPSHGTLSGIASAPTYQPAANYNGPDSFTFRVNDGQATSAPATVSIAVQAVNDSPSALPNAYTVAGGTTLSIAAPGVLGNDTDVESSPLVAQLVSAPTRGSLALNATGAFTYTPQAGYAGSDSFSYRASDGAATSGAAVVSLTVLDATPPVRTSLQPSGSLPAGTTQATIRLTTNEAATCRHATSAGVAYASMTTAFTTTGGTTHSRVVTGLSNGATYRFYVRCVDQAGNPNTNDAAIVFSVATPLVWNSWDVVLSSGSPQGRVTAAGATTTANVEFYESANDFGVARGAAFASFVAGTHPESFNKVGPYWRRSSSSGYPYAGKSTVNRGADTSEGNATAPTGVKDLQVHPPNSNRQTVVAFRVPSNGTYAISNLGVRRVSSSGNNARLRVFNAQGTQLVSLNATNNQDWVRTTTTYTLTNLTTGQYIYFGVDRNGEWGNDATEIAWKVTRTLP
jgi:hypothetical protein